VTRIGPVLLRRVRQHFGTLSAAWNAPAFEFEAIEGIGPKLLAGIQSDRARLNPAQLLAEYRAKNFNFWIPEDEDYPRLLLEIPSPPTILYYRGQVDQNENLGVTPAIAIVGTRNATEYGERWTRKISAALAKHGFTVVSGMATGIDTIAHRSCLQAGGRTLAVLGTGVDVVYPRHNQQLYEQIQERGLVLSEYPVGTPPEAKNFPPRNRIIAGLCRAVLVMEAARRSGALITARYANEFGRDVYALPGSLDRPQSSGCLELSNRGAHMILGEGHLLEMLGEIPHLDVIESQPPPTPDLPPVLARVWDAIATEPTPLDLIVTNTGLTPQEVNSAIIQLELQDLIAQLPGLRYQKS